MYKGERFVDRAVRLLTEAGAAPIVVVLGAWLGEVPDATCIVNDKWATGMGSSLRVGLQWLDAHTDPAATDQVAITLVDLLGLTSVAIRRIVDANADGGIALAGYQGVRGHPVVLARKHWAPAAISAHDDIGARAYLADRPDISVIEVGDLASGEDTDTPPSPR